MPGLSDRPAALDPSSEGLTGKIFHLEAIRANICEINRLIYVVSVRKK